MCKPIWLNVKRSNMLSLLGRLPGAVVPDPSYFTGNTDLTILDKIKDDNGFLFIVSHTSKFCFGGNKPIVAALWYPNFGGAGWVDLYKDPQTRLLCDQWDMVLRTIRMEREAQNCMAL